MVVIALIVVRLVTNHRNDIRHLASRVQNDFEFVSRSMDQLPTTTMALIIGRSDTLSI
jgi:hypothetical protein